MATKKTIHKNGTIADLRSLLQIEFGLEDDRTISSLSTKEYKSILDIFTEQINFAEMQKNVGMINKLINTLEDLKKAYPSQDSLSERVTDPPSEGVYDIMPVFPDSDVESDYSQIPALKRETEDNEFEGLGPLPQTPDQAADQLFSKFSEKINVEKVTDKMFTKFAKSSKPKTRTPEADINEAPSENPKKRKI